MITILLFSYRFSYWVHSRLAGASSRQAVLSHIFPATLLMKHEKTSRNCLFKQSPNSCWRDETVNKDCEKLQQRRLSCHRCDQRRHTRVSGWDQLHPCCTLCKVHCTWNLDTRWYCNWQEGFIGTVSCDLNWKNWRGVLKRTNSVSLTVKTQLKKTFNLLGKGLLQNVPVKSITIHEPVV